MAEQEIKDIIQNRSVSDEDVFHAIKAYTADRYDDEGELLPVTEEEAAAMDDVRVLLQALRPQVMEWFRSDFLEEHSKNCPTCQALKNALSKQTSSE